MKTRVSSLRVCYIWEMGMMVRTAELERLREKRIKELEKRRESFIAKYKITEKEQQELSKLQPPKQSDRKPASA